MLHKSSSNPDLIKELFINNISSSLTEPLKRTNSSSSLHSLTPISPAPDNPLYSSPSFCIYTGHESEPTQEPTKDFTFTAESEPESAPGSKLRKESIISTQEPFSTEPTKDFTFREESEPESSGPGFRVRKERRLPLFLARGLGIDRVGSGLLDPIEGTVKWMNPAGDMGSEEEKVKVEMELKRIVEDEPKNALALRDYAQFLCQVKGDAKRAEEYYSRAILIEPLDGEILSEYAKLVWDLHADVDRALSYFEKALTASPQNNNVFAAYAAFMWEIEETDDGSGTENFIESNYFQPESQAPSV